MTHTTEDTSTIYYSEKHNTTVSGLLEQQDESKHNTTSKDTNTIQDDSSTEKGEQYSMGDICVVAQTLRCLQFHTARIQTISGNNISVI